MRPLFIVVATVALIVFAAAAFAADPVGTFNVEGKNPDGSGYQGTVTVTSTGQTYQVVWEIAGTSYTGVAVADKDSLAVSYQSGDSTGVALYKEDGDNWQGVWTFSGGTSMGTEVWKRQAPATPAQQTSAGVSNPSGNCAGAATCPSNIANNGSPPPYSISSWPAGIKDLPCAAFLRLDNGGWKTASPLNIDGAPVSITTQPDADDTKMIDAVCAAATVSSYASAGITIAPSGSAVDKVGQFILGKVAGRTTDQMASNPPSNEDWLDILHQPLLQVAGVSSFGPYDSPLANGQFSIDADFGLPGYGTDNLQSFDESDPRTPPAMMFAFMSANVCYGGYVAGYPVPNQVYVVDMNGQPCDAATVSKAITAAYLKATGQSGN
jgi:hypothetical protein